MYDPTPDQPTLLAAGKAIEKTLGKFALEPGTHPIDATITLKLTGVIEKAGDQVIQAQPDLPLAAFLALLCRRAKLNREDAKNLIADCAQATFDLGGKFPETGGFPDRLRDAEDAIAAVRQANKSEKSRAGAIKWLGTCSIEKAR